MLQSSRSAARSVALVAHDWVTHSWVLAAAASASTSSRRREVQVPSWIPRLANRLKGGRGGRHNSRRRWLSLAHRHFGPKLARVSRMRALALLQKPVHTARSAGRVRQRLPRPGAAAHLSGGRDRTTQRWRARQVTSRINRWRHRQPGAAAASPRSTGPWRRGTRSTSRAPKGSVASSM